MCVYQDCRKKLEPTATQRGSSKYIIMNILLTYKYKKKRAEKKKKTALIKEEGIKRRSRLPLVRSTRENHYIKQQHE